MHNLKSPTQRSHGLASPWLLLTLLLASAVSVGWAAWDVVGPGRGAVALRDRPIQHIRVGERVWGTNPQRAEYDRSFPEPDAKTWRLLRLVMHQPEGETLAIELLRPTGWINEQRAAVGRTIELDLPELGAAGPAEVLAIEPCPPIQPGPGQVVTGTFAHKSSRQILNLQVADETEPIGVTDNHPIWSATRQEFVEAGKLAVGEELVTLAGTTHVTSITPRGPPEPVYNLEVQGEHVYLVASSGVLVHNACGANSSRSLLPNEGYGIINKKSGDFYKFGVTARGVDTRFAEQANRIARLNGVSAADLEAVKLRDFADRADALQWEKETVGFFRDLGHILPNNIRPRGIRFAE